MRSLAKRWMVGVSLPLLAAARARGEDQVGFAHESYVEDHGRMTVNTEALRLQLTLSPWLEVTARGVYDAISGATPTGAPAIDQLTLRRPVTHEPVPNSSITGFTRLIDGVSGASPVAGAAVSHSQIPLAESRDIRRGGDVAFGLTFGPSRLTPQFSYSEEDDYVSWAGGLNYSLELNDKNTVLSAGWSHAYDRILPTDFSYVTERQIKNTDEFVLGVTQLLGPKTVVSLSGTIGHANGYLNDPYRSVVFEESALDPNGQVVLQPEKRPSTRDSQALLLLVTQAVTPLDASIEASYRFYHDSYGIIANTVGVQWFQKIGRSAVVSPSFRYYRQEAADFYGIQFPGDPNFEPARVPTYYSSDYRLSFLETFTLGIEGTVHLGERCDLRLGYQRYWMRGLDHQTLQSVYPSANIFTVGLNYRF
jgi:hypothetical protein